MSEAKVTMRLEKPAAWWKEPMLWLIIGLPACAVVGAVITLWFATDKPDAPVSDGHRKEGLALYQSSQREQRAAALGLSAHLQMSGTHTLTLDLHGRLETPPGHLSIQLIHPTDPGQDTRLMLDYAGEGHYRATLPPLPAGKRRVIVEPADQDWRLIGRWEVPFIGTLDLAAGEVARSSMRP